MESLFGRPLKNCMTTEIWIAGIVGIAAIIEDLAARRISNWIPICALVGGIAYHSTTRGWHGLASSLGGALGGLLVFLVFYLLGGMGGGDVKLMGGFGALLGVSRLLQAALFTALIGGLLAAGVLAWRAAARMFKKQAEGTPQSESIPYAPAIALGVWLAMLPG
jgi:prepilin peptidase CpaA